RFAAHRGADDVAAAPAWPWDSWRSGPRQQSVRAPGWDDVVGAFLDSLTALWPRRDVRAGALAESSKADLAPATKVLVVVRTSQALQLVMSGRRRQTAGIENMTAGVSATTAASSTNPHDQYLDGGHRLLIPIEVAGRLQKDEKTIVRGKMR